VSRNWFGVVGSGHFAHYLAGTRVERLRTIKGAFAYAGKRYMAKKEEMPVMEQKPGRYWGVIGREHLTGIFEQEETEETEIFFSVLCSLCSLLFKIASSCGDTVWRTRRRRSGNICAKANCARKISRPSSFATSSFGLNVCRN
jgi:hypothetical protein